MNHPTLVTLAIALICTGLASANGRRDGPRLVLGAMTSASEPLGQGDTGRVDGRDALALAGIVAAASPLLSSAEKEAVAMLFGGNNSVPYDKKIVVNADKIVCQVSNIDITLRSCQLTFGKTVKAISGRPANELFATEAMAGVPDEGAAGTIYEGLSKLHCTIDPREIRQHDGGGGVHLHGVCGLVISSPPCRLMSP